jgi:hypothetical protein
MVLLALQAVDPLIYLLHGFETMSGSPQRFGA